LELGYAVVDMCGGELNLLYTSNVPIYGRWAHRSTEEYHPSLRLPIARKSQKQCVLSWQKKRGLRRPIGGRPSRQELRAC
ncbi:MAG TPA: hypothetical protein VGN43_12265, partial [Steroidobacteraceae bacterium]|nr:hypothetical protein [Steroidobacteraceae bacterium]